MKTTAISTLAKKTHMLLDPQQDVEDKAHGLHLGAHHAGAADEGEKPRQKPGGAAVSPPDDTAHRAFSLKPGHTWHQIFADENHRQAEAE